jgi:hypothetical protein
MLRLHDGQATLWEEMLPEVVRLLSDELSAVDTLLDDRRFLDPFVRRFNCPIGRPTIPMDTYLRLMYLKHRHGLGYETLSRRSPTPSPGAASAGSTSTAPSPIPRPS